MIVLDLVHNIALLVALSVIFQLIISHKGMKVIPPDVQSGLLFGVVGLVAMMTPVHFSDGIIFDGRSIILSVAGLFGGPIPAGIAGIICAAYRWYLGGAGTIMGISVIFEASLLGVVFYYLRKRHTRITDFFSLLGFGVIVHVIMVGMMLLLPAETRLATIRHMALPVLLVYPLATVLVCMIFTGQEEKQKTLSALRENEEIFNIFMENSPIYVFFKDENMRSVRLSRNYENMLGKPLDEMIGKSMYDLFPSDFAKKILADDHHILQQGKPVSLEEEFDGRFYTTIKFPIHIDGKPTYLAGYTIDNTDRKHTEEEKERIQAQLLQAQKIEAIGQLAGGVAHDFNNMLTVIIGHAEISLKEISPTNPLAESFRDILKAARHSTELTQQLLAFARKQIIRPKVVNLNDVVADILPMLQRLIGESINLRWMPGEDIWSILIDPAQVHQILTNIVVNSRDAIDGNGTVIIETGLTTFDKDYCETHVGFIAGEYVLLSISDDGSGMDKEALERIYEPFFTTKQQDQGTGLGLATVYGIVKQNNGFINVYSEPGEGTTFKIYFPQVTASPSKTVAAKPARDTQKGTETILMVEDEKTILELGARILKHLGYSVLSASTPSEALDLVEKYGNRINLVLSDVVLPEMNGRELMDNILKMQPTIKSIFMSGYTANVIAHHGVLDEGVHFLPKPFNINTLVDKVRSVLDGE